MALDTKFQYMIEGIMFKPQQLGKGGRLKRAFPTLLLSISVFYILPKVVYRKLKDPRLKGNSILP